MSVLKTEFPLPDSPDARAINALGKNIAQGRRIIGADNHTTRGTYPARAFPAFGANANQGYSVDHSWHFTQTGPTTGTLTPGNVYIGGVDQPIIDWPVDGKLDTLTTTESEWLEIDLTVPSVTFNSGASLPVDSTDVEYWELVRITCAGSVISKVKECQLSDIHIAPQA